MMMKKKKPEDLEDLDNLKKKDSKVMRKEDLEEEKDL